jgi:glycosyltransferase involved in cell wall biosynthesis
MVGAHFRRPNIEATDMETPTLSIIVPIHNRLNLVSRTVQSLIVASRHFFTVTGKFTELVFVDDCSDPKFEPPVISDDEKAFSIKTLSLPKNCGQVRATNYGCAMTSAEYCMILHSDDILEKEGLEILHEGIGRWPNVAMSVGERSEIGFEDDEQVHLAPFYDNNYIIPGNLQAQVFLYSGFLPCQVLFRRSSFMQVGGVEPGYDVNLDGLLWFKISLSGDVVYTQRRVSRYRRHPNSETGKANSTCLHLFEWYATHRRMLSYAQSVGLDLSDTERNSKVLVRLRQLALRWDTTSGPSGEIPIMSSFGLIASALELEEYGNADLSHPKIKPKNRNTPFKPPLGSTPL